MLCWTISSPCQCEGWLACHPLQGDSTFIQVQPPHQELPGALPSWTSCFEYRFLLLMQLQETAKAPRRPQATRVHPATMPTLLLPCWDLGPSKDPTCISHWAASLPMACSCEKASDIICKDRPKAGSSSAVQETLGPKQGRFLPASVRAGASHQVPLLHAMAVDKHMFHICSAAV